MIASVRWLLIISVITLLGLPNFTLAQSNSALTPSNVTSNGTLSDPNGGLFSSPAPGTGATHAAIHFPNLITAFTGTDFLGNVFTFTVNLIALIGGVAAFGYLLYGGVKLITSGGAAGPTEEAKKMILGAVIGILIIAFAYVLVLYVRNIITSP